MELLISTISLLDYGTYFLYLGSTTDLENPFITNYEQRGEQNLGFRTYFSYNASENENFDLEMQLGAEGQKGWYRVRNYENHGGTRGGAETMINYKTASGFISIELRQGFYKNYQRGLCWA